MNAKEIREFRKSIGWTQQQLADALGVTNVSVHKWEKEIARPHPVFDAKMEEIRSMKLAEIHD